MFQFGRSRLHNLCIQLWMMWYYHTGLPHSESSGSKLHSSSPEIIAGNRVLHRLLMPRHPPAALTSLTKNCVFVQAAEFLAKFNNNELIYNFCLHHLRGLLLFANWLERKFFKRRFLLVTILADLRLLKMCLPLLLKTIVLLSIIRLTCSRIYIRLQALRINLIISFACQDNVSR